MVILGGWVFLMSEVSLYSLTLANLLKVRKKDTNNICSIGYISS